MSIKTAEADILAKLKALLGSSVRAVEALPGDWDDDMLKRLLRLVPGVFVAWAGGAAKAVGSSTPTLDGRWLVYVATGHASGEAARRLGDAQQVGAYDLIELIAPNLHGHTVPGMGTLALQEVTNLYTGVIDRQGLAVYALAYALPMSFDLPPDDALAPFVTFTAQYDLAPTDGAADAADTVTLPQA